MVGSVIEDLIIAVYNVIGVIRRVGVFTKIATVDPSMTSRLFLDFGEVSFEERMLLSADHGLRIVEIVKQTATFCTITCIRSS